MIRQIIMARLKGLCEKWLSGTVYKPIGFYTALGCLSNTKQASLKVVKSPLPYYKTGF